MTQGLPAHPPAPPGLSAEAAGRRFMGRMALLSVLTFAPAAAVPASTLPEHAQLIAARDLICHFHKAGTAPKLSSRWQPDWQPRSQPESDLMMIIEDIDGEAKTARAVSTRSVGRKPLSVYQTDTRVHFVQQIERSVVVTTVEGCEAWRTRRGERVCRSYRAVNAWHFDESVHRDPDASFLKLPGTSYHGHCEPWKMD